MNDTQLQIVISLVNEAAGQLSEVGSQLATLGTQANEAADQISSSLTAAEEAAADAATAAAAQWDESSGAIVEGVTLAAEEADAAYASISDAALAAANQSSESFQASLTELRDMMAMTSEEIDTEFGEIASAGQQAASSTGSSFSSMHSYFRGLIVAYAAERIGQGILGGVESAVTAAAGDPQKVAQLTDQINQLKASIASNEVELTKWYGTTAQVSAAHQKAAADIATAKEKIQELQQQLQPLQAQQQAGGEAAKQYDAAVTKLNDDWQTFMATVGVQLLPLLTKLLTAIDTIIEKMTAWAEAHPKLTEYMLVFAGVLGGLLIVVGSLFGAFVVLMVAIGLLGGAFVAVAAVIAVAIAGVVALIATNWNWIRTETTKLISDFEAAWNALKTWWDGYWNAIYTTIENVWSKIEAIISAIESALSKVTAPVAAIAGSVGASISGAIKAFASGGIVTSPTLALVGEAGPEAIIPLSAFAGGSSLAGAGGGSAGAINIYIQGGTYLDQNGAAAIADALAKRIGRQTKLRNFF